MFHINEKNLHLSGNNFKSLEFFEKASHNFIKASIPLKKPQIFYYSLHFFENVFKKPCNFYKSLKMSLKASKSFKTPHINGKSLHFPLNVLKKPRMMKSGT
jgi:hypothetical protein